MDSPSFTGVGRLIVGLLLVVLGVLLLLGRVTDIDIFSMAWPFFIILPGLVMLLVAVSGGARAHPLAIPGSIVTAVGLLLFVQQAFDLYASWAYAWALIAPTAVGFGIWLNGRLERDDKRRMDGIHLIEIGAILFGVGFVFFEMFLNLNGMVTDTVGAILGGVLLIAGGGLLIFWSYNRTRGGANSPS